MPDVRKSDCKAGEILSIMRAIQWSPEATQREFSSGLDISLEKVSSLTNALIKRGLAKTDSFKKNKKHAYLYVLNPAWAGRK